MALPHISTGQLVTAGGEINAWIDAINLLTAAAPRAAEFNAGNTGAALTLNFATNGPLQKATRTGNTTLTLVAPATPGTVIVRLIHDGTASVYTVTFSPLVKWDHAAPPVLTNTAGAVDLITLYWDGALWWGAAQTAMA